MRARAIRFERQRHYPMSLTEAWRLLADTDHLNRSIGLPPIKFSTLPDPLLRGAEAKAFGVFPVRWKEFPFEWVCEQRYVVRREFEHAPVRCMEVGIELTPDQGGVSVKPSRSSARPAWRAGCCGDSARHRSPTCSNSVTATWPAERAEWPTRRRRPRSAHRSTRLVSIDCSSSCDTVRCGLS